MLHGLLAAALLPPGRVARAQALAIGETSVSAVCFLARTNFWGAEAGLSRRAGQGRVGLAGAGGWQDGSMALRVETRAQFLLLPPGLAGVGGGGGSGTGGGRTAGYYAGLGLAFAGAERRHGAAYLTAVIGIESAPWRARGMYAEVGLGGGVRLAAGVRWRRVPAWWP